MQISIHGTRGIEVVEVKKLKTDPESYIREIVVHHGESEEFRIVLFGIDTDNLMVVAR